MNKSAVSILVQLFVDMFACVSVQYLGEKLLVHWVGICLALFEIAKLVVPYYILPSVQ